MTDTATENKLEPRPYKPSWIDSFTQWVENLSLHAWIFYFVFGIALVLIQILFLWVEGGLQATEVLPVIIFNGFAVPFVLALIHFLDNQAVTALSSMKPSLEITEPEFVKYEYRLSNMPSRSIFFVGLTMVVSLILTELFGIVPVRYTALDELPIFKIVFHIIDKSTAFLFGSFIYHTIVQLRLVDTIYSNHTRINLFDMKPLYAFSKLTASTAVGLVIGVYGWMVINPELLENSLNLAMTVLFTIMAVAVFIWPLFDVHRLMKMEKESALRDIDLRFEEIYSKFNRKFQEQDYPAVESINGIISSLEIQHRRIEVIPTWPWSPETPRFALTAIALPLFLMIIGFLVEQALGL